MRDEESFTSKLESGRRQLVEQAADIGRYSFETLQVYQELRRRLKGGVSPQLLASTSEIGEQAQQLVYAGFVSATPLHWLPHLARYLRAALQRLDSLAGNSARERTQSAVVRAYRQRYEEALEKGWCGPQLDEFRWLIEELRVSLFAQTLGTSVKVSPQRLDRLWQDVTASQGS